MLFVGCGPRNFENENDRLRALNLELTEQVTTLTRRVEDLQQQLEIERQATPRELPEGINPPVPVRLEIDSWTTAVDTDRDRTPDAVRVYLLPRDAQQRVVQVVGEARIEIVALPVGGEAVTVQTTKIEPQRLNQSYHTSLTGPHYTLVIPITEPLPDKTNRLLIRAEVTDFSTGKTLTAERTIDWSL